MALVEAATGSNALTKDRLRFRKQPYAHFKPMAIAISVAKTGALQLVLRLADDTDEDGFRIPDSNKARAKLLFAELAPGVTKDLLIVSTLRSYEYVAMQRLSAKRAGQLITDTGAVARHKYEKTGSRIQAAISMFPSTIRGSVLVNAAVFTVEVGELTLMAAIRAWKSRGASKKKQSKGEDAKAGDKAQALQGPSFTSETLDRLLRCMGTVLCEAVGASLGTIVFPGTGTVVFQLIGSFVCWLL